MVVFQSSKVPLPPSSSQPTSLLLEPNSLSLALIHSDSSLSLYPPLSFSSLSSLPPKPQIFIPPPTSSSSFVLLRRDSDCRPLFLAASPHKGGSQILIRMYILQKNNLFTRAQVVCSQRGLGFDSKLGVLVDVNHGVSIKIIGSVNFFVMYSVSSRKVWVFALKLIGDCCDGDEIKLMRCAVIECSRPVWSISVSFGFMILGEDNGVRVFNLRQLVKGNAKKVTSLSSNSNGKLESKGSRLPNGVISSEHHSISTVCNGLLDGKIEKPSFLLKQKSVRCREDSSEGGAFFMSFKSKHNDGSTVKAVSIQALSPNKFVILDSIGDIHLLCLSTPSGGGNLRNQMMHFPHSMKVQKLAVLPDISSRIQSFWISDGFHSVHMMSASETEGAASKNGDEVEEKLTQISVVQAIFSSEKVQDLVPLAGNAILVLGQGNIYTYGIP